MSFTDGTFHSYTPPSAEYVTHALTAIQRHNAERLADQATKAPCGAEFLVICKSHGIYEKVRGLIPDKEYWAVEQAHFDVMVKIVRDIVEGIGGRQRASHELDCPALESIKAAWEEYRDCQRQKEAFLERIAHRPTMQPGRESSRNGLRARFGGEKKRKMQARVPCLNAFVTNAKRSAGNSAGRVGKKNSCTRLRSHELRKPPAASTRSKGNMKGCWILQNNVSGRFVLDPP